MNTTVRVTRGNIWSAAIGYTIQSLFFLIGILFLPLLRPPLTIYTPLNAIMVFTFLTIGALGIYRLYHYVLRGYMRAELRFDGEKVTVCWKGKPDQSFTQSDVRAYYPHRNSVLLAEGRLVKLPGSVPHLDYFDAAMADPWVNAWWPGMDLPVAVKEAKRIPLWHAIWPNVVQAFGLVLIVFVPGLTKDLPPEKSLVWIGIGGLLMAFVKYEWLGRPRRRAAIHFPCNNGDEAGTVQTDRSACTPPEQLSDDHP